MRRWFGLTISLAVVLICGRAHAIDVPGTGDDAGKTVVYRDTWGVPHIYAPTMEAALYAQGWAQAEDRPAELLKNLKRALGEWASIDGPRFLSYDMVARVWDHYGVAQRNADKIDPVVRKHIQAYARGMRDYYAAHPEDVPDWWDKGDVNEYQLIAFGRLFLYAWSIEQAFADLGRIGIEPGAGQYHHGSNEWAVAPQRSAEGAAILLIDPHLSWWGMSRFWEFRVHAGDWNGSGFTLPGSPYIGLGHTDHLAWAMTTGGPDTADVYELTLNADNPSQYLYDGKWRQMTKREFTIAVKGGNPVPFTIWDSHYGPVIAMKDGKAYAARTAYADSVQVSEAWLKLNMGQDYTGAVDAMATLQLFPQNVMVADTAGNIYYERTGKIPKRPKGFDWSRPVNGSTSATEWQCFHPSSDHVHLLNPETGYMQNCNIPPDVMIPNSPLTQDKYPPYLYSDMGYGEGRGRGGWTGQRGARAVELLAGDDAVTWDEALAYAEDTKAYGVEQWQAVLQQANDAAGDEFSGEPLYRPGIEALLAWDGFMNPDSAGALKYYYWRMQLLGMAGPATVGEITRKVEFLLGPLGYAYEPEPLTQDELHALAAAVSPAMVRLQQDYGSLDAVWGDKFRVGRGDKSWPVGGGSLRDIGMRALRSVGYGNEREDKTRWGNDGQTSTQVVIMTSPPQSWTAVPIGQSDRPDSPHYRDQAERLFSEGRLKPTWWQPEDLVGHVESRTVLEHAP